MVQHEVVLFTTFITLLTLVTLLNVVVEANLYTSALEMNARQIFVPFLTLHVCREWKAILSKKFHPSYPAQVFIWKNSYPICQDLGCTN